MIVDDYHNLWLISICALIAYLLITVFNIFRASRVFGPMGIILERMLNELLKFLFLEWGIQIVFIAIGRVLFYNISEFSNLYKTVTTLLSAGLGNFDYDMFDEWSTICQIYGFWYLTTYILVMLIAMLNFLIAIISNVYDRLKSISNGLYLRELIFTKQFLQGDERFTAIVTTPSPLNIIILPFIPFVIILKSKKFNEFVLHIAYAPVLIIGLILFVLVAILLTPISYIIILYRAIQDIFKRNMKPRRRIIAVIDTFIFLVFGMLILLIQLLVDIKEYLKSNFTSDLITKYSEDIPWLRCNQMDKNFYCIFINFLRNYKENVAPAKKIVSDLSKELKIPAQIHRLLFQLDYTGNSLYNE